ncbi:hypothetical protein NKG94_08195 [Micromonospora sp. M12]
MADPAAQQAIDQALTATPALRDGLTWCRSRPPRPLGFDTGPAAPRRPAGWRGAPLRRLVSMVWAAARRRSRASEASGRMTVRRIMGTEVEYGISVPGQAGANPMVTSSQVVNAYGARRNSTGRAGPVGLRGRVTAA